MRIIRNKNENEESMVLSRKTLDVTHSCGGRLLQDDEDQVIFKERNSASLPLKYLRNILIYEKDLIDHYSYRNENYI